MNLIPLGGPYLEVGQIVKCKKEGFLYKVVEVLPEVPNLYLERYRLELVEGDALRRCTMQDMIARAYILERYRIVRAKAQKLAA